MSSMKTIPRTIVKASLVGLRLPLTTIELAFHKGGSDWTPAVAYDSFEAETKQILGSLLRDDELTREGRIQRVKVGELSEAERLETQAELERQESDARLAAQRKSAEQARVRTQRRARQREQELTRKKAEGKRTNRQTALRRKEAAARTATRRGNAVAAQEQRAERTRVVEKSATVAKRRQAMDVANRAKALDTALETKKGQRRRAGSRSA